SPPPTFDRTRESVTCLCRDRDESVETTSMLTESLSLLRELVEIESPTYSPGVREVAARMGAELELLGGVVRILDGDHVVAEFDGEGRPPLLLGHTDTVWEEGTLEPSPCRVDAGPAF